MNLKDFAKIIRKAEKQISVQVRAHDLLFKLRLRVEALNGSLRKKEDWLELRRLAKHGKRIAKRFSDPQMTKYFGVLFNTSSTYLGLPGDCDQKGEAYALT